MINNLLKIFLITNLFIIFGLCYPPRVYKSFYKDLVFNNLPDLWYYNNNAVNQEFFVGEAQKIIDNYKFLDNKRIISEDDILYSIMVLDPKYLKDAYALQTFNVKSKNDKISILNNFDYIVISKKNYGYYYLKFAVKEELFRSKINLLLNNNSIVEYGNVILSNVYTNKEILIIKINNNTKNSSI